MKCQNCKKRKVNKGFTILELLCVIGIMSLIAALSIPAIKAISVSQMHYTVTPKALVQEIHLARQKAIATRLDTYILFAFNNVYSDYADSGISYSTNTPLCQSWCIAQHGRNGDQPGQHSWHQCSGWHSLPDGVFFNPYSLLPNQTPFVIATWSKDYGKPMDAILPLNSVTIGFDSMPCIGFKGGSGALMAGCSQYIVLITGKDYMHPDVQSTSSAYTVIEIDQVGRAMVEQERAK